jgi:hypothetical protein
MYIRKISVILGILLLAFALIGCGQAPGDTTRDLSAALKQANSGTQGVLMKFAQGYPPQRLYDVNNFVSLIELENKGNYDLLGGDCFLKLTGFDPNIIRGADYVQSCGILGGKTEYNLDGGFNQIEYKSSNIFLPTGTYEYSPNLNLVLCYDYQTKASATVCIDPQMYQIVSEQKACQTRDVSLGGGQAAPVAVSYVGVDNVGDKAIFEITVRNVGNGRVLSPYAPIASCGDAHFDYQDLNKVNFRVEMTGGSLISCTPSDYTVRLNDAGSAKILCTFRVYGSTAYETPLRITLDYAYLDTLQKGIQIVQTP